MRAIRAGVIERFGGPGRVPRVECPNQIMAEGAAWIAPDGVPLTLAKPFEVLHADDVYVPLVDAAGELPTAGLTLARPFSMYLSTLGTGSQGSSLPDRGRLTGWRRRTCGTSAASPSWRLTRARRRCLNVWS